MHILHFRFVSFFLFLYVSELTGRLAYCHQKNISFKFLLLMLSSSSLFHISSTKNNGFFFTALFVNKFRKTKNCDRIWRKKNFLLSWDSTCWFNMDRKFWNSAITMMMMMMKISRKFFFQKYYYHYSYIAFFRKFFLVSFFSFFHFRHNIYSLLFILVCLCVCLTVSA